MEEDTPIWAGKLQDHAAAESASANRRHKVNLAVLFDILQQSQRSDDAVDGDGYVRFEAIVFNEPILDSRMGLFEFVDYLSNARTANLNFRLPVG